MKVKKVLDTILFKTCIVRKEIVEAPDGTDHEWKAAYSLIDGSYIGDCKRADMLERMGIMAQRKRPDINIASIGFCKKEQKFYGWSHRAMYGFGIGSEVKKGSCAYKPFDPQDLLEDMTRFWVDDEDEFVTKTKILRQELDVEDPHGDRDGLGALLETERTRKKDNKILSSTHWNPYPDVWGKGEWKAKTLEDAKQMAIDFSDGVS